MCLWTCVLIISMLLGIKWGSPYSYSFVGGADVQLYAPSSQSMPSHATQTFLVKIVCTVTLTANTMSMVTVD